MKIIVLFCLMALPVFVEAQFQADESQRIFQSLGELRSDLNELERKNRSLEQRNQRQLLFTFLCFGVFCAYWAMTTGRNPWLWFFLGLVFSIFAGIEILYLTRRSHWKPFLHPVSGKPNRVSSPGMNPG